MQFLTAKKPHTRYSVTEYAILELIGELDEDGEFEETECLDWIEFTKIKFSDLPNELMYGRTTTKKLLEEWMENDKNDRIDTLEGGTLSESREAFDELCRRYPRETGEFEEAVSNEKASVDDLEKYVLMHCKNGSKEKRLQEVRVWKPEYERTVDETTKDIQAQLEEIGKQCRKGFVDGLKGNTDYMPKSAKTIISAMIDDVKKDRRKKEWQK